MSKVDPNKAIKYGAIIFALYFFTKMIKGLGTFFSSLTGATGDNSKDFNDEETNQLDSIIDSVPKDSQISDIEAQRISNLLFNAMQMMGTDERQVYDTLQLMSNKSDWTKVFKKFGKKGYSETTGTYDPFSYFIYGGYDLDYWIHEEFKDDDEWGDRIFDMVNWLKDN